MASETIRCPKCGEQTPVPEGDDGIYIDSHDYESTCAECGAEFHVAAVVTITWCEPELYQRSEATEVE